MTEDVPELPSGDRAAMEPTGGAFGVNSGSEAARRYDVDRTRGTSGKVLRLQVRESGGAGWQVRSVPVRGDGRFMMSRRRRMNAAASRPAIVRARAGEDRRPPVFGEVRLAKYGLVRVPPIMSHPHSGLDSQDELNRLRPNSPQRRNERDVGGSGRSWGSVARRTRTRRDEPR